MLRDDEVFYTDKQLKARWHCSHMKLWRLRRQGKLTSIKVGDAGRYLTPAAVVMKLETEVAA